MTYTSHYKIHEVATYINWLYFFHAWNFPTRYGHVADIHDCVSCRQQWLQSFSIDERIRASEALKLLDDARDLLRIWDAEGYRTHFRVSLFTANADGEDLVFPEIGKRLSLLRQQHAKEGTPCLCLADFVRPLCQAIPDRVGIFASTVDAKLETLFPDDDYKRLLAQTLADRLAEATAEVGHLQTRREWWGYAADEQLSVKELHHEKYQGKRPAVGYPSMPDQSLNFLLDEMIGFGEIGISLTENGAMIPHASTSGLMLAHPATQHFAVGEIGEDQLVDYAQRRGVSVEWLRKFL